MGFASKPRQLRRDSLKCPSLNRLAPVRGSYNNRPSVGEPYGRLGGYGLLWESVERVQRVAKLVP